MQFSNWFVLSESKQTIVSMGFPEIISKLLYEKYDKLAPLIAKWYKQYRAPESYHENPQWWRLITWSSTDVPSLYELTYLYEASADPESYRKAAKHMDISLRDTDVDQDYVDEKRPYLVKAIRDKFFGDAFFTHYHIIHDITSGKLTDVAAYKRLKFQDAAVKYDSRRIFDETTPIKIYPNGFKWVDVGKHSDMLYGAMRNCGSVGLMSTDKDRTIITLFGPNNKPHVMVTYSPNEKRISGDECAASTAVKPEYHDYVIDLADHLGATFDTMRTKSTALAVKYRLRNKAQSIEPLIDNDPYDHYFRFMVNGQMYYTNGYYVVSDADVRRVQDMVQKGELKLPYPQKDAFKSALIQANRDTLADAGIRYTLLTQFAEE